MKKTTLIFLFLVVSYNQIICQEPFINESHERPKVGLVLSGGSAHGLAHIGVIEYLEELNIPIDYITGTSMGAIVGGLKALGYDAKKLKDISNNMQWNDILNDKILLNNISPGEKYYHRKFPIELRVTKQGLRLPLGFVSSNNLDFVLSDLYSPAYKIDDFNDLPIPFQCFTVDIAAGKVVALNSGNLSRAIRASMAIPSLFPPIEDGDKLYIDGGLMRNFPAEELKTMGADVIIGSYVGAVKQDKTEILSLVDIMRQSGFLLSLQDYDRQIQYVDVLIRPDIKEHSSLNFDLDEYYINQGYIDAKKSKNQLIQLRDSLRLMDYYNPPLPLNNLDFIYINDIKTPGVNRSISDLIIDKLGIETDSYTTIDKIERGIRRSYATKSFYSIWYTIQKDADNGITLIVHSKPVRQMSLGVNVNRFNSTNTSFIIGASLKNFLADLTDLRLTGRISEYPGFAFALSKRGGIATRNFIYSISGKVEQYNLPMYGKENLRSEFDLTEITIEPNIKWEYNTSFSMTGYYHLNYHFLDNKVRNRDILDYYKLKTQSVGLIIEYNTLDDQALPRKGINTYIDIENNFQVKNKYEYSSTFTGYDYSDVEFYWKISLGIRQAVPLTGKFKFTYKANLKIVSDYTLTKNYLIGGNFQDKRRTLSFIGQAESQLIASNFLYGKAEIEYEYFNNCYVGGVLNMVAAETPLSTYLSDLDNEVYLIGIGLSTKYDLPTGPLEITIGKLVGQEKLKAVLTLGYRHIF